MRSAVCSLLFLTAASLAEAQHSTVGPGQGVDVASSIGPGETSCKNFWNREDVLLTRVRPALELAMHGGKVVYGGGVGYVTPLAWQNVQMLGDGTSVGVLKAVSPKDLTKPGFVNAYLQIIRIVFSEPKWAVCAEDKTPEVTVFLLDYLREKVNDEDLRRQIDSTKQYILNQTRVDSKPSENDSRYKRVTMGMGRIEDRTSVLGGYDGPNGEQISTVVADFGIITAAKAAHEHVDHSAAEIVKQEDILDDSGKLVGYRSVLTLADKDGKKSTAVVITKGGNFTEYISSSLRDILAFEGYEKSQAAEPPKR